MAHSHISISTNDPAPAVDVGALDFSLIEVKQLWWFLDGSIMNVGTRHHLWRSGGCARGMRGDTP